MNTFIRDMALVQTKPVFGRGLSLSFSSRTRVFRSGRSTTYPLLRVRAQKPNLSVDKASPIFRRTFIRCGFFSIISINTVFAGSVIWHYENWRKKIPQNSSKHGLRERFRKYFQSIFGRPPRSTDIFWGIALVNFLVFLGNNTKRASLFTRYFANSPYGPCPAASMLSSTFSHQMFFHLLANMYVLHNFTNPVVGLLGMEQFFALYIAGGVFSSFLSILSKAARRCTVPSIGASGAVCAILGTFCMLEPNARLCIPFLVNIVPHSFSSGSAVLTITAFELFGAVALCRRSPIDHAAHLGGLLFGMYYAIAGRTILFEERQSLIDAWRRFTGSV